METTRIVARKKEEKKRSNLSRKDVLESNKTSWRDKRGKKRENKRGLKGNMKKGIGVLKEHKKKLKSRGT
jgi:hypothetical protein